MKGYKQSLKELAKQFPAYGVPNTVITENLNGASRATSGGMGGGSVFEGLSQTEYLSTTVMVGCKSVPGLIVQSMLLSAAFHLPILFAHINLHFPTSRPCVFHLILILRLFVNDLFLPFLLADVGETNTVLLREMVLRASHFDLEFTVENSGEGWREGL
jgi:hypothetical protein